MNRSDTLSMNKSSWEREAPRFFGRAALPDFGPLAPSEDRLQLFGEISGKRVLDIGCGSGHSLKYMAEMGAEELWGLDLTSAQIEAARQVLENQQVRVSLFESPMEKNPGLPADYFDIVYSIYALGWTVDLKQTLDHIHSYLKPGGTFIFSWEHPMHDRISYENGAFQVKKSYQAEGPELNEAWKNTVVIHHRKLSTYVNTLIDAGFIVEKIIDDPLLPEEYPDDHEKWYSVQKAVLVPATFIVKVTKPV
ncbi:class I SAM-dependent methyltransferase [Jeotgalibacillus aurantiacus]|uniref:class I SAM-dependent methyltransferase n=1 Tax=Jeotgalibacillus aurantiacus TaxID=2763266 RepID=UPI001D0A3FE1|nr:class I SAM-dependent methyltransferase [Jeotgalibacillus aurantiacus]